MSEKIQEIHNHPGMEFELKLEPNRVIVDSEFAHHFNEKIILEDGHIVVDKDDYILMKKLLTEK